MAEKIVFLGADGVGKTALIERIRTRTCAYNTTSAPESDYLRTTEATFSHQIALPNNHRVNVALVDTTGERSQLGDEIRNMHMVFGDGFVVVFSVISRRSFEMAKELLKELCRIKITLQRRASIPLLLVGTFAGEKEDAREVSVEEARQLSTAHWQCDYRETSNRLLHDVKLMEGWMVNDVVARQKAGEKASLVSVCRKFWKKVSGSLNPAVTPNEPKAKRRYSVPNFAEVEADGACAVESSLPGCVRPRARTVSTMDVSARSFVPNSRHEAYVRAMTCTLNRSQWSMVQGL